MELGSIFKKCFKNDAFLHHCLHIDCSLVARIFQINMQRKHVEKPKKMLQRALDLKETALRKNTYER
jgi:hypothetical protein